MGSLIIVLPGLIDHQYAKFAARYGILVDSAILKVFTDYKYLDFWILSSSSDGAPRS